MMADAIELGVLLEKSNSSRRQIKAAIEADQNDRDSSQDNTVQKKTGLQRFKLRVKDPFNKKKIKELKRSKCVLEKVNLLFPTVFIKH